MVPGSSLVNSGKRSVIEKALPNGYCFIVELISLQELLDLSHGVVPESHVLPSPSFPQKVIEAALRDPVRSPELRCDQLSRADVPVYGLPIDLQIIRSLFRSENLSHVIWHRNRHALMSYPEISSQS